MNPSKRNSVKPRAHQLADWAFGVLIWAGLVALLIAVLLRVVNGQEPTPAPPRQIEIATPAVEPHSVLVAGTFDALAQPGSTLRDDVGVAPRGWSLPVEIVEVYDGDTVTVAWTVRARVRLLDCWAPELRDAGGPASKKRMEQLALGKQGVLYIPPQKDGRLDHYFTFGRVLAKIWIKGDVNDLSGQMVEGGFATKEKAKTP